MAFGDMGLQVQVCEEVIVQVSMLSQEAEFVITAITWLLTAIAIWGLRYLKGVWSCGSLPTPGRMHIWVGGVRTSRVHTYRKEWHQES